MNDVERAYARFRKRVWLGVGFMGFGALMAVALSFVLWVGVLLFLAGALVLAESLFRRAKYRALRETGLRDPWDSRTGPTHYGPWRPGEE